MSPSNIRDGLPTVDELLKALALLQVPVDQAAIGLRRMTEERQRTALLGVLTAWANAYSMSQNYGADPLSLAEVQMLVASSETEVTAGDAVANLNLTAWRLQWAALTIEEVGRTPHPSNPAPAIVALLKAATILVSMWRDSTAADGFEMDGRTFGVASGMHLMEAVKHVEEASAVIRNLAGPAEPAGG